jgi:tRNA(Met) cytidine acetyltransferase
MADHLLHLFDPNDLLFVEGAHQHFPEREGRSDASQYIRASEIKSTLGQSFSAVVMDFHEGFQVDLIGQCHGLVRAGGSLLFLLPPNGTFPRNKFPKQHSDLNEPEHTDWFWRRFEALLEAHETRPHAPLAPFTFAAKGTKEQGELVLTLVNRLCSVTPTVTTVLSRRGRGKSSAIGLALNELYGSMHPTRQIAFCAAHRESTKEIFAQMSDESRHFHSQSPILTPVEMVEDERRFDIVIVEEAAQVPIPLLKRIVTRHDRAHLVFCSTTEGYEGTGRGFTLKFLKWLKEKKLRLLNLHLKESIRWNTNDSLERFVYNALLLDAKPSTLPTQYNRSQIRHVRIGKKELANNTELLRGIFGLLLEAHYRTSPQDLYQMIDAPQLHVHALLDQNQVLAVNLISCEGALPLPLCDDIHWGQVRPRGHALAETLIVHSGVPQAGALNLIRSVRIAVHPEFKRQRLASILAEQVHEYYKPDLFGTLFGGTPDLVKFRRQLGYDIIRFGARPNQRSGHPTVVMVRPVSAQGEAIYNQLRSGLSRDLPLQLGFFAKDHRDNFDPVFAEMMQQDLPPPSELENDECRTLVSSYAFGSRPFESVAFAMETFVRNHASTVECLPAQEMAILQRRILEGHSWRSLQKDLTFPTVPAAMRALRSATRALLRQTATPVTGAVEPVT